MIERIGVEDKKLRGSKSSKGKKEQKAIPRIDDRISEGINGRIGGGVDGGIGNGIEGSMMGSTKGSMEGLVMGLVKIEGEEVVRLGVLQKREGKNGCKKRVEKVTCK